MVMVGSPYRAGWVQVNVSTVVGAPMAMAMFERFKSAPEVAMEPSRRGNVVEIASLSRALPLKRNQPAVPAATADEAPGARLRYGARGGSRESQAVGGRAGRERAGGEGHSTEQRARGSSVSRGRLGASTDLDDAVSERGGEAGVPGQVRSAARWIDE